MGVELSVQHPNKPERRARLVDFPKRYSVAYSTG